MNHKVLFTLVRMVLFTSIILAACKPASQPSQDDVKTPTDFSPILYEAKDCSYGGVFQSMQAVDAYTVRFRLCMSEPAFLSKIAFGAFGIYPKEFLEKYAGTPTLLEKPIGTGPYKVTEWKRGEELNLTRFDGYWGVKAQVPTLIFRWSSDPDQRLLELQSGSVDGIDEVSPKDFSRVAANNSLKLMVRPALNIFYIGMNNTYPPYNNEKVRQAIAMGIDRNRMVNNLFPPGSEVASHFSPCSIPNGCAGESWYNFDPERARQLLKEAGFPNGFETVINYRDVERSYLAQPGLVAQELQAQLRANLNINAKIELVDKTTFLELATAGQLKGLHLLGWSSDYPEITDFLDYHFGPGSTLQFGIRWNDVMTALVNGSLLEDTAARRPYYEIANNSIKQHVPLVPIAHGGSAAAFRKTVEGAHASPLNSEYFAAMSNGKDTLVFMQTGEPRSLYCNDETEAESFRPCNQVVESLMRYRMGSVEVEPSLATRCTPNINLSEWTCTLRPGVKFHDGSTLDARDVVESLYAEWNAASPLHKGSTGAFDYWNSLWGNFLVSLK